jgi:hypothetical protein
MLLHTSFWYRHGHLHIPLIPISSAVAQSSLPTHTLDPSSLYLPLTAEPYILRYSFKFSKKGKFSDTPQAAQQTCGLLLSCHGTVEWNKQESSPMSNTTLRVV